MSKMLAAGGLLGALLLVGGCAVNATVGHQSTRSGVWFGDLGVTGHGNNLTVQRGSRLHKISFIGDNNTVTCEDDVLVSHIEFWGSNNTITIPAGLLIRVTEVGKGNTVIRRPERWTRYEEGIGEPEQVTPPPAAPAPSVEPTPVPEETPPARTPTGELVPIEEPVE